MTVSRTLLFATFMVAAPFAAYGQFGGMPGMPGGGEAITTLDIEQRTKFIEMATGKVPSRQLGVDRIYTWTAGFEAPAFYAKNAYEVFGELENYYPTGHSRIGLRKTLGKTI
jgi:hypothetical protein